jgi:DNA transformation protein
MFGATGVFCDGAMLGIVAQDALFLRVDAASRDAFAAAGFGPPLRYRRQGVPVDLAYWRAPDRLLDDPEELLVWARSALAAARRGPRKGA